MPFPARIASWDIWSEDAGAVLSWEAAGWDGSGEWAVHRRSVGAGTGTADGTCPTGQYSVEGAPGTSVPGSRGLPYGYYDVTDRGLLSIGGGSALVFRDLAAGTGEISYLLELKRDGGTSQYFGPRTIVLDGPAMAAGPRLLSASPNPFSARVEFLYFVPDVRPATLRVFDAAGRAVFSRSWKSLEPGVHRLNWNGRNDSGARLGAGVYFYSVESAGEKASGKLLHVR
jgi:hypothetical protein